VKISSNLWRYWLPIVALSLFLSRCLYEANPIQFVSIGDWLAVLIEAAAALLIAYVIKHLIDRRQPDWTPPDLSAFLLLFVYVVWPQVDPVLALIVFLGALALLGANTVLPDHPRWFELTLVAIVFALYFATLSQHVGAADTFEFQVVMPQWGIAHPTGYPLFVTLGKLFSLLPLGSMALRLNVLSALIGTLAVWVIYRLIVRLTQPPPPALFLENEEADFRRGGENNRLPAAIAALLLAASTIFWSQAIVIEVYGLNALLVAVVLWLLVRLLQNPESRIQKWLIYAVALTLGLGLSHHLDSVILFMPAALTLFFMRPKLLWRSWLIAAGCFLLGLTPWLLIFFRWPALHNGSALWGRTEPGAVERSDALGHHAALDARTVRLGGHGVSSDRLDRVSGAGAARGGDYGSDLRRLLLLRSGVQRTGCQCVCHSAVSLPGDLDRRGAECDRAGSE
jgi:hypothetical protein